MYNILVVDDEALIREGMRRAIEGTGLFAVRVAPSGAEALQIVRAGGVDAMLLDIAMPDMNGLELMKALLALGQKPATIIISGYEEFDYAKQAIAYGAVDYLLKPVDAIDVRRIARRLHALLEEGAQRARRQEQLRQLVLEHREIIKQKLLNDIIGSQADEARLKDIREVYSIDLRGEYYMAAVVSVKRENEALGELDFQVALRLVGEAIERAVAGRPGVNLFNMENARFVLLVSSPAPFDPGESAAMLDAVAQSASRVEGVACYVGKGDEVKGLQNLAGSYHSADEALGYRHLFGAGNVYDIGDYRPNDRARQLERSFRELEEAVRAMRYGAAAERLGEYFDCLEEEAKRMSPAQIRFYALRCFSALAANLLENGVDALDAFQQEATAPSSAFAPRAVAHIRRRAERLLATARGEIAAASSAKHHKAAEQVRLEIERRYADSSLSVNGLSAQLNYSANYLGNAFKREYGLSINDYLNKYRIAQAKRLMDRTDLMIYEIAFQVGFNDQHYFSKTFKKYEDLSPSEYRARR